MKKLLLLLVTAPLFSLAQITISENTTQKIKVGYYKYSDFNKGELSYIVLGKDTTISIICLDQKYQSLQQYASLSFKGGAKEKDQLYDALMSFYSEANKSNKDYKLDIKLGQKDVRVFKSGKLVYMSFDNTQFGFAKANIVSLFGKKE